MLFLNECIRSGTVKEAALSAVNSCNCGIKIKEELFRKMKHVFLFDRQEKQRV